MSQDTPAGDRNDQRNVQRYSSSADAVVVRDSDQMRIGIQAKLYDVSATGVGINMPTALEVGEHVKVRLRNVIQRVDREARGTVRRVTEQPDGTYHVGIALLTRLTPLEVSLLKQGMHEATDGGTTWI